MQATWTPSCPDRVVLTPGTEGAHLPDVQSAVLVCVYLLEKGSHDSLPNRLSTITQCVFPKTGPDPPRHAFSVPRWQSSYGGQGSPKHAPRLCKTRLSELPPCSRTVFQTDVAVAALGVTGVPPVTVCLTIARKHLHGQDSVHLQRVRCVLPRRASSGGVGHVPLQQEGPVCGLSRCVPLGVLLWCHKLSSSVFDVLAPTVRPGIPVLLRGVFYPDDTCCQAQLVGHSGPVHE